jgi:hypothetical protein
VEPTFITTTTYFTNNVMIRRQIPLSRAVVLMNHTSVIIPPDADLLEVRCPGSVVLVPMQIIFNVNRAFIPHSPLITRRGVYQRDHGLCAYCGKWMPLSEATMDHIVPFSLGGPTRWENIVNACRRCNGRKANRTPTQAQMPLLFQPHIPKVRLRPD